MTQRADGVDPAHLAQVLATVSAAMDHADILRCVVAMRTPGGLVVEALLPEGSPGAVRTTVLAAADLAGDGSLGGIRWARIAPAVPIAFDPAEVLADQGAARPEGRAVFTSFVTALGEGPAAAAVCFAEGGVFSHAAYVPGRPRILVTGRQAIESALADRRPGPPDLQVVALVQVGRWVMIDGRANTPEGPRPFVSSFSVDPAGRLLRYVSAGVNRHS